MRGGRLGVLGGRRGVLFAEWCGFVDGRWVGLLALGMVTAFWGWVALVLRSAGCACLFESNNTSFTSCLGRSTRSLLYALSLSCRGKGRGYSSLAWGIRIPPRWLGRRLPLLGFDPYARNLWFEYNGLSVLLVTCTAVGPWPLYSRGAATPPRHAGRCGAFLLPALDHSPVPPPPRTPPASE